MPCTPQSGPPGALEGIRVVDLTRILAGPYCTMLLGDMGALVTKVEQPGKGDDTRGWGPPFAGSESAYNLGVNRNKRSITVDLKTHEGVDILKRLACNADVLIDNFKPGTMERLGLDRDWRESEAPQLVHCQISGYGTSGPKGGGPGYDFILQAETGLMSITGEIGGEPMKMGVAIVDICTGMYATSAILAALMSRDRIGAGQRIEVCLHDTGISMLAYVASAYLVDGQPPERYGNGHPNIVPYRAYPVRDGQLVVTVANDAQFRRFAELIGRGEWADDPRFARNRDRVMNRDEIDRLICEALSTRNSADWIAVLDGAGIPCARINSVPEALNSAQTAARDLVVPAGHPTLTDLRIMGVPFRFDRTPSSIRRPPPMLGEHTDEVLRDDLGFTEEQIADLRARNVV